MANSSGFLPPSSVELPLPMDLIRPFSCFSATLQKYIALRKYGTMIMPVAKK